MLPQRDQALGDWLSDQSEGQGPSVVSKLGYPSWGLYCSKPWPHAPPGSPRSCLTAVACPFSGKKKMFQGPHVSPTPHTTLLQCLLRVQLLSCSHKTGRSLELLSSPEVGGDLALLHAAIWVLSPSPASSLGSTARQYVGDLCAQYECP